MIAKDRKQILAMQRQFGGTPAEVTAQGKVGRIFNFM